MKGTYTWSAWIYSHTLIPLACRKLRNDRLKVFYTAHGFHFYKGAPVKNWLLYYPIEKLCAKWTDVLIVINQEDYILAKSKLKATKIEYIPGVGIDLSKYSGCKNDREVIRNKLGIPNDALLLLSVGELNNNKNHETVIRAISDMNVYYAVAGKGDEEQNLRFLIDSLSLNKRVQLLGYRNDVEELYYAADIFVFPSFREGLSVSLMEAMASQLPCVVSKIRGNVDLIDDNGGALFDPHSIESCQTALNRVINSNYKEMGIYNLNKIKNFDITAILPQLKEVYLREMKNL